MSLSKQKAGQAGGYQKASNSVADSKQDASKSLADEYSKYLAENKENASKKLADVYQNPSSIDREDSIESKENMVYRQNPSRSKAQRTERRERMTFKEYREQKLSCEECPAYIENICSGGEIWVGDGFMPPPCENYPDEDMDKWVENVNQARKQFDEIEERKQAEELRKKEIARKRAETARQMKSYCYAERQEVARLKKAVESKQWNIRHEEDSIDAINFANLMFEYKGLQLQVEPRLYAELDNLKEQLKMAQDKYKVKRKEFYNNRRSISGK